MMGPGDRARIGNGAASVYRRPMVGTVRKIDQGPGGTVWVDVPGVGCVPARPWAVERVPATEAL